MVFRACLFCLLLIAPAAAEETPPADLTMNDREQAFAAQLSGAALVGRFTAGNGPAKPERYELGTVKKVAEGQWLIPARIVYGDHDVTLPITLPVEWAGDTAVIVVDNIGFPGLGQYSARVLIHNGRYAGYWHGANRGGHLFGTLEKPDSANPKGKSATNNPS